MKNIKKLLCIVLVLISVFAFNACEKNDSYKNTKYPPAVKLNIREYCATCDSNEKLAEVTYVGNRYFLTGEIYEITQSGVVKIYASNGNSTERFRFTPLNENDVLALYKGQIVTATGTLTELPAYFAASFEDAVFSVE